MAIDNIQADFNIIELILDSAKEFVASFGNKEDITVEYRGADVAYLYKGDVVYQDSLNRMLRYNTKDYSTALYILVQGIETRISLNAIKGKEEPNIHDEESIEMPVNEYAVSIYKRFRDIKGEHEEHISTEVVTAISALHACDKVDIPVVSLNDIGKIKYVVRVKEI